MNVNSISSLGQAPPVFSSISESLALPDEGEMRQLEPSTFEDETGQGGSGFEPTDLERQIFAEQSRSQAMEGREVLAVRVMGGTMNETTADGGGEGGMTALVISRPDDGSGDFDYSLLQVNGGGESRQIYTSNGFQGLENISSDRDLDLRGNLLEAVA